MSWPVLPEPRTRPLKNRAPERFRKTVGLLTCSRLGLGCQAVDFKGSRFANLATAAALLAPPIVHDRHRGPQAPFVASVERLKPLTPAYNRCHSRISA